MIAYDRRGFGRSSQPTVEYGDTFAADLAALLEHLDLTVRSVVFLGVGREVERRRGA